MTKNRRFYGIAQNHYQVFKLTWSTNAINLMRSHSAH